MTKNYSLFLTAAALAVLTACSTTPVQAPVEDRSVPPPATQPKVAPVEEPKDKEGYYTVRKGDTLIRIAFDRGLNYRELAAWNNLSNPDDIKVDQVLRLSPPEGVQVSAVPTPQVEKLPPPPRKTAPKGEKRPYSETAAAELQKPEGDKPEKPAVVASAAPAPAPAAPPAPPVSVEDQVTWIWPSDGRVIAQFDEGKNKGIDIAGRAGQQVLAASAGKVMYAGSGIRGYGNLVIVKHNNSLLSAYAHNRAILVKEGQDVRRGQAIAEMGDSDTDAVKLHFEIRQQGKPVDPTKFLPNR